MSNKVKDAVEAPKGAKEKGLGPDAAFGRNGKRAFFQLHPGAAENQGWGGPAKKEAECGVMDGKDSKPNQGTKNARESEREDGFRDASMRLMASFGTFFPIDEPRVMH